MAKVGILGSGDVGKTLAKGFLKHGYQVAIGSDHAEKLAEFKRENPQIETATFEHAAQSGDTVVLCVKGTVAKKLLKK
jgi:predicted dinucleotide-binding enzyme